MIRNITPNYGSTIRNKLFEILYNVIKNYKFDFISREFVLSLNIDSETYSVNFFQRNNRFYYKGYPTGNYLKIIAKVFEVWEMQKAYPINFIGFSSTIKDQTSQVIDKVLNPNTYLVVLILGLIREKEYRDAEKMVIKLLEEIKIRGLLTILGVRTTQASCDMFLITKDELMRMINVIYCKNNRKSSISVGARALSKHYDRNKDNFWFCNGSEEMRNQQAIEVFKKITSDAAWINIHYLPNKTTVLEIRNYSGYGMRWNYNGEFRGLIEPEEK